MEGCVWSSSKLPSSSMRSSAFSLISSRFYCKLEPCSMCGLLGITKWGFRKFISCPPYPGRDPGLAGPNLSRFFDFLAGLLSSFALPSILFVALLVIIKGPGIEPTFPRFYEGILPEPLICPVLFWIKSWTTSTNFWGCSCWICGRTESWLAGLIGNLTPSMFIRDLVIGLIFCIGFWGTIKLWSPIRLWLIPTKVLESLVAWGTIGRCRSLGLSSIKVYRPETGVWGP